MVCNDLLGCMGVKERDREREESPCDAYVEIRREFYPLKKVDREVKSKQRSEKRLKGPAFEWGTWILYTLRAQGRQALQAILL